MRDLAGRFEHRLFLSATPHNGHSNSFSTLVALLDPSRFTRGVKVTRRALDHVMVRCLKVIDDDVERRLAAGILHREVDRLARGIEHADLDAGRRRVTEGGAGIVAVAQGGSPGRTARGPARPAVALRAAAPSGCTKRWFP